LITDRLLKGEEKREKDARPGDDIQRFANALSNGELGCLEPLSPLFGVRGSGFVLVFE
jgi:hypothetical protein